jgi:hypothetical protein
MYFGCFTELYNAYFVAHELLIREIWMCRLVIRSSLFVVDKLDAEGYDIGAEAGVPGIMAEF